MTQTPLVRLLRAFVEQHLNIIIMLVYFNVRQTANSQSLYDDEISLLKTVTYGNTSCTTQRRQN